jgi:hypothetical protein
MDDVAMEPLIVVLVLEQPMADINIFFDFSSLNQIIIFFRKDMIYLI